MPDLMCRYLLIRYIMKVLVVEDNPLNQLLIVEVLKAFKLVVSASGNGKQALEKLATDSFEMILMDINMPEMDGIEATKAIREQEKSTGKHIPIVALTADDTEEDRKRCSDAGMDDFLTKPINPTQLKGVIARWSKT